jgi:rRNA maturation endonuclease Nob1
VPALGFFVCNGCDTVYADVEEPPRCHRCGDSVEELGPENQAFDYFTGR